MAAICRDYKHDLVRLADRRFPNAYHYIRDDDLALGRPLRKQGRLPYRRLTLLHLQGSPARLQNQEMVASTS